MKKSVVILIAIIYVTSIALVSFFGLAYKVFNEVIDVQSIELLNEGLKDSGDPEKGYYAIIQKNENGEWKYQIKYRVHPDNATNTKVDFSYNKNQTIATVCKFFSVRQARSRLARGRLPSHKRTQA